MSRDNKFRVWLPKGGYDKQGSMILPSDKGYSITLDGIVQKEWSAPGAGMVGSINGINPLYDAIIIQFADVKDKIGGILNWWEGDILCEKKRGSKYQMIFVIVKDQGSYWAESVEHPEHRIVLSEVAGWDDAVNVIGNVWENPELVKSESKAVLLELTKGEKNVIAEGVA